ISLSRAGYVLLAAAVITSCNKNDLSSSAVPSSSSNTIAVAASSTVSTSGSTDSVYLMQPCQHGEKRDSIAQSDLPSSISTYISTNYSGSTFKKAFALKNSTSTVIGYVVVIYYNDKPVGLQFDSAGNFVKVLEQREKGDLDAPGGFHHGGRFDGRDGQHRDTIALSSLPATITAYFASNYSSDTLVRAFVNRDNSVVVLSKNNGVYATVFTSTGTFVKRDQLPTERGSVQSVELSALPSAAASYLSQTYPNYVFEKAFSFSENGTVKGYVVVIDANNTKYAVEFDAAGNFVAARTIH
ncbi:MAG: PepSY-like domain-containing protein, partial [Flavisolibacter sp.]